jgi:hypothetical protein
VDYRVNVFEYCRPRQGHLNQAHTTFYGPARANKTPRQCDVFMIR